MKVRLAGAAGLAVVTALSLTAQAGTPTLDGKKVKKLTASFTPVAQDHDADQVTGQLGGPERVECAAPRCAKLPFTFAPARGTSGPMGFALSWGIPVEDLDLFVGAVSKSGVVSEVAHCAGSTGTSEKVLISGLKAGKYVLIADFYRSTGSKVSATVTYPAGFATKSTIPAGADELLLVNCTLS